MLNRILNPAYHLLKRVSEHLTVERVREDKMLKESGRGRQSDGREDDAIEVGLQHARAAEEGYRALKNVRELARVWESIGRLLMKAGQSQQALEVLERALQAQQQLGDMIGLARTTGAVAELLCAAGDLRRGLLLMRESLALNQEKLSAQGLYYNRQSFDAILKQLSPQQRQVNQLALGTLAAELGRAEARMERIRPSSRG